MSQMRLDVLSHGMEINFREGDLAVSSVYLVRSRTDAGVEQRTVIDCGHVGMRRRLLASLAQRGLTPEDIDFVALTHVHWDHVQNLDLFTNARVVMSRAEWRSIQPDTPRDIVTPAWTRALVDEARLACVDPGDELISGIEFLDAAGHTAGSLAFMLTVDGRRRIITGDALPSAEVALLRRSALVFWDLDRSQATIDRLVELADVLYPGHDRPFQLIDGEIVYETEFGATMVGATPATAGLRFEPPGSLETVDLTHGKAVGPRWTEAEVLPVKR